MTYSLSIAAGSLIRISHVHELFIFVTGRIRKAQAASIKFTHGLKIRFFAPQEQEQLIVPIHVKLGTADGHVGRLGCAKFHFNRHRGEGGWVGRRP